MKKKMIELPYEARELVPHRGTMLLIDELSEHSPEHVAGKTVITPKNPFLDHNNRLEGVCFIEMLAQLAAAGRGYEQINADGPVKTGYLAGVNDFSIHRHAGLGDTLHMRLNKVLEMDNVTVGEGSIYSGHECLATGRLKLYVTGEESVAGIFSRAENGLQADEERYLRTKNSVIYAYIIMQSMKVLERSEEGNKASGEFAFDKGFPGFHGHFPAQPILPGVVMIDMSLALCEAFLGYPVILARLQSAKFTKVVQPEETVRTEIRLSDKGNEVGVSARLISGDKPVASFSFTVRKDETGN